jgi:hypothetical protein
MIKRRGSTFVEVLFTMILMIGVMGAVITLYIFVVSRSTDVISRYSATDRMRNVFDSIVDTGQSSLSCTVENLGSLQAIKCIVPADGVDSDQDGILDKYRITNVHKFFGEYQNKGARIWYYPADITGTPGTWGKYWFKAVISNDNAITTGDIDRRWSFATTTRPKNYIEGSVWFAANPSSRSMQMGVNFDTNSNRAETDINMQGSKKLVAKNNLGRLFFMRGTL